MNRQPIISSRYLPTYCASLEDTYFNMTDSRAQGAERLLLALCCRLRADWLVLTAFLQRNTTPLFDDWLSTPTRLIQDDEDCFRPPLPVRHGLGLRSAVRWVLRTMVRLLGLKN